MSNSIRTALFVGAMVASGYNAAVQTVRARVMAASEPKLVVPIAAALKPIIPFDAILRDGMSWHSA